jgi:hypothetical protein
MESKNLIIIGGAIALFYLYQKNKTKKSISVMDIQNQDTATQNGGMPMPSGGTPKPIVATPIKVNEVVQPISATVTGSGATFTGNTSVSTLSPSATNPIRPISETEIISTPSINNPAPIVTPIEVAIQQGGVSTNPRPHIAPEPSATIEEALISGGVAPIIKSTGTLSNLIN